MLAFFRFVVFESTTSHGDEAKNPLKTMPKAVTISGAFVGMLFIILAHSEVLGFARSWRNMVFDKKKTITGCVYQYY